MKRVRNIELEFVKSKAELFKLVAEKQS